MTASPPTNSTSTPVAAARAPVTWVYAACNQAIIAARSAELCVQRALARHDEIVDGMRLGEAHAPQSGQRSRAEELERVHPRSRALAHAAAEPAAQQHEHRRDRQQQREQGRIQHGERAGQPGEYDRRRHEHPEQRDAHHVEPLGVVDDARVQSAQVAPVEVRRRQHVQPLEQPTAQLRDRGLGRAEDEVPRCEGYACAGGVEPEHERAQEQKLAPVAGRNRRVEDAAHDQADRHEQERLADRQSEGDGEEPLRAGQQRGKDAPVPHPASARRRSSAVFRTRA